MRGERAKTDEPAKTKVVYRLAWAELPERVDGDRMKGAELAIWRLFLQIALVALLFGGLAAAGSSNDETDSSMR